MLFYFLVFIIFLCSLRLAMPVVGFLHFRTISRVLGYTALFSCTNSYFFSCFIFHSRLFELTFYSAYACIFLILHVIAFYSPMHHIDVKDYLEWVWISGCSSYTPTVSILSNVISFAFTNNTYFFFRNLFHKT